MQPLLQWKSNEYYTTWVCVCSRRYPTCNAHAPYCYLWPAPLYNIFPHYLIKGTIFEKKVIEQKLCVLSFSATFVWNVFYSKKNSVIYDQKCVLVFMWSTVNFCPMLMESNFLDRFWKILKYQISWKSVQWGPSSSMLTDGRTERHDEANSRFSGFCERS